MSEPIAELTPRTMLLASETPNWCTLSPKRIAPKPQANPNPSAEATAARGACASTTPGAPIVAKTTALGMTRQEVRMNTSQMFSHFQRGITFIGAVNSPFDIPDSSAKEMPSPTMLQLPPRLVRSRQEITIALVAG
jgi:hypothetical protein